MHSDGVVKRALDFGVLKKRARSAIVTSIHVVRLSNNKISQELMHVVI